MTTKIDALRAFLDTAADITPTRWDEDTFAAGKAEFLVLTDEEADDRVAAYIADSLWAFRAEFLAHHLVIEDFDAAICVLEALQEKREGCANDAILAMVKDIDMLIEDAIRSDGRGHFLAGYDGVENEQDGLFIYRN